MSTPAQVLTRSPWTGNASAEEFTKWLGIADQVALVLAEDALTRDRDSTRPVAAVELLRSSGLANFLIPVEQGGHGGHWETAFAITRRLARVDASIAQILGYHWLNQACVVFYGPDVPVQREWLERSASNRWIWSDAFNPVSPDLSLVWNGDRYVLNGVKRFATGAAVADIVISGAEAVGGPVAGQLAVFAVNPRAEGVEHPDDWDHLGQRSSASGSIRFTDVPIAASDIFGTDIGEPFSAVVTPGVQLLFGNIYVGIARGALEQARRLTLDRPGSWFLSGVDRYADDPITQRLFGELVSRTVATEALADRLNREYDDVVALGATTTAEDRDRIEIAVAQLKVVSTDVGIDVTTKVYEATGASATKRSIGLDMHWRNIRTHSLHDPVDYKRIEVGAHFLTGATQPISLYT